MFTIKYDFRKTFDYLRSHLVGLQLKVIYCRTNYAILRI